MMSFARSPSRPHRTVLWIAFLLVTGCTAETPTAAQDELQPVVREVVDSRIDAFLEQMVDEEHFSGVVYVATQGRPVHARAYGLASAGTPNTLDTAFHVASVSKQFTAAAVMQLVEAGTVELGESINRYLPERYRTATWESVTVHHLLSHSSGIADYAVTRDYYEVVDGFCLGDTVDGMIREAMAKELEFAPGSRYRYSNIGFTLLGEIIANSTGTPYAQYLEERILAPMGMMASRVHVEGHVPREKEAAGHRWDEASGKHVKDDVVSLPVTAPDGGLVTTLDDFLKWVRLYDGDTTILSQASIDAMTTKQVSKGRGGEIDAYGYGLDVGDRLIGHSGYIVGFRSRFDYARENETLVVVFTNNTTNSPERISGGLLTILFSPAS